MEILSITIITVIKIYFEPVSNLLKLMRIFSLPSVYNVNLHYNIESLK